VVSVPPTLGVAIFHATEPQLGTGIATDDPLATQCPLVQCSHPFLKRLCRKGARLTAGFQVRLFEVRCKGLLIPGTPAVDNVYILIFSAAYRVHLSVCTPRLPGAIGRSD
jgi:hypothetical protein